MPVVSAGQQAEWGKTRGSSQSVHSIRRAFQMYGGASEGDAVRRPTRRVPSTSTWVQLGPRRGAGSPPISHNPEIQRSWDVLRFVKSMRRKQKQTRPRSDEDLNLGKWWGEFIRTGRALGGGRKGSDQRDLSTVEICWGFKLNFLKVTFIFHGAWCRILRGRFCISWGVEMFKCWSGGGSDSQPSHADTTALPLPLFYHPSVCNAAAPTLFWFAASAMQINGNMQTSALPTQHTLVTIRLWTLLISNLKVFVPSW